MFIDSISQTPKMQNMTKDNQSKKNKSSGSRIANLHTREEIIILLLIICSFGLFLVLHKKPTPKSRIHWLFEPIDRIMLPKMYYTKYP